MSESGNATPAAASPVRSTPPEASPPPAPPLISPTGSPGLNCVIDVVNNTAAPFQNAPDPEKGFAGQVENTIGMVTGVLGAPDQIIDTAFAAITAPIAALFPALPAITLLGMHIGSPHTHTHPPSFIPPAPPVPLPSIGMLLGAGSVAVLIGGVPAARAGDIGLAITCGSLAPPFEVYTGSSNVFIGGARAARMGDITKHCNPTSSASLMEVALAAASIAAGAAAMSTGGGAHALAQAAADAAIMAVKALAGKDPGLPPGMGALIGPPVPNVLIGGFPCPGIGSMVTGAFKAGLKKGLGKLKSAVKSKLAARKANGCKGDGSHPIYLVTGENFDEFTDFDSGGLFKWKRHYTSARSRQGGPLGFGWRHYYQRRLERRLHRATFTDWDGLATEFPRFELGSNESRADGYVMQRLSRGHFRISYRQEPALEFEGGEFDSVLRLTRIVDGKHRLAFEYDAQGRLAAALESREDELRLRRFEFRYTADGYLQELCEVTPAGSQGAPGKQPLARARYQHSAGGELTRAEDALGGPWSYRYDPFHRLVHQSDPRGYAYSYSYDASGRCTDASGQDGLWWCHIQYFPEQHLTRYTEGDNATYDYRYDSDGIITKIVDPYGGELRRELDAEGRLVSETDSGGREIRWLYDANGAHFARIDRFGNVFPPELEQPQPPNPFARELPSTAFGWLFAGHPAPAAQAMLGLHESALDAIPQEVQQYARGCFRARLRQLVAISDGGAEVSVDRDALGRQLGETDGLGRSRRWLYDATGNLISERDRDGSVTTQETTSWNLVGTRTNALGHALRYQYSKLEQVVAITDPLGDESRYDYDLKERLVRVHRHGRLREEYVYDRGDHFIEKRDGQGRALFTNEIHKNHFVARRKLTSGGEHRFDYDGRGRITKASTEAHEIELEYTAGGERSRDMRDGVGVEHRHSGSRNVATIVAERFSIRLTFSATATELIGPTGSKARIELDPSGLVRRSCSNGTIELLQFDEQGRLEGRLCYRRDGYGRYAAWATRYAYSAEGDLLQASDSQSGTTSYEVDAAHRLIAEHTADGKDNDFTLDRAGNLVARPGVPWIELDSGNRLKATPHEVFTYDDRNHLSERRSADGSVTRYTYDSFDWLVDVERNQAELPLWPPQLDPNASPADAAQKSSSAPSPPRLDWHAAYDALGRRSWTRWADGRREFYWDGDRLAAETFPSGAFRVYQYASPEALAPLGFADYSSIEAAPETGKTYHVFSSPVGMPLRIEDERGLTVWRAKRVDPYGALDVASDTDLEYNLRWPGHYFDPETGLHYNRYRYYDPTLGRYLQSDPIGYEGSPINLYAYCANPLVAVDVLGLDHNGKTKKGGKDGPGDVDGQEGTKGPKLRGVSDATIALAASPGNTKAHIKARKLVAKRFYKQHGKIWDPGLNGGAGGKRNPSASEARAQLKGIDYSKPVSMGPPPATPAKLEQWQRPGGRQGQFYAEPGTSPGALGIHDKAGDGAGGQDPKVAKTYDMNQDGQPHMKSTAAPIKDTWSDEGHSHYAEGGGTQYYVPNDTSAKPAAP